MPQGLLRSEAIFAIYLLVAIPIDAVSPTSSMMCCWILAATSSTGPISDCVPLISRKASSMEICCTWGEYRSKMDMICSLTCWYRCMRTGM